MRTIPKTILDIIRSDAIDSAFVMLIHLDSGAGVFEANTTEENNRIAP